MSLTYEPDENAVPDEHWRGTFVVSLAWMDRAPLLINQSQRDASGQVPINFVTVPGIQITKACFVNGVYDNIPTQRCISDLLAAQFRRLVIDLYWDATNLVFNLCPVEIPPGFQNASSGNGQNGSTAAISQTLATSTDSLAAISTTLLGHQSGITANALTASAFSTTSTASSNITKTTAVATSTGAAGTLLLDLGPYKCSPGLNLQSVIDIYQVYLANTSDTVSARLQYLVFNLHAASASTAPTEPAHAPLPDRLPGADQLVGAQFGSMMDDGVYTPERLQSDRSNLNQSWYHGGDNGRFPIAEYFNTFPMESGDIWTPDGWPSMDWLLFMAEKRLLLSWGQVDPQMLDYDFQGDAAVVFPAGSLHSDRPVESNATLALASGCFYRSGVTNVSQVNSSWAASPLSGQPGMNSFSSLVNNMTACGISPMLNATLGTAAAETGLEPYQNFIQAAIFGWAPGEPRNASQLGSDPDVSESQFRCVLLDATASYQGLWRVENCQSNYRAACRIANQPYAWQLSTFEAPYGDAAAACPNDTVFALPRTGLENTYLYHRILVDSAAPGSESFPGVWVNLNSIDQKDCWVTTGANGTCPYSSNDNDIAQRQVLIPTIAALIVLILTVLTLLVKCNQNRRNSRTRRRGGGWEYEGVPS